jgi:4-amino-4-deoxy-L-arabinose transferase-like glycosyltransferase
MLGQAQPSVDATLLQRRLVWWAVGLGFAFLLFNAARSGYDHDEIAYLHASWLVAEGQKPFLDFMEHHHPTLLYLLAPLTRLFQGSPRALVFAARLLDLALLAVLLAVFTKVVRPVLRERSALWPPLLLLGCYFFVRNSMEVRPDPWMCVLCFIGLWQWLLYLRGSGRLRPAVLAGLSFGAATAFLPKAVFFVGLVGLGTALALRNAPAWRRAVRGAAVALAAGALPLAALALGLWGLGIWNEFVFWNYVFTPFYYWATHFDGPSAAATLLVSIGEDTVLWAVGLWGLGLAVRSVWHRQAEPEVAIALVVVVGFILAMFQTRWPFSHNLLLMQPPLALLAAVVLDSLLSVRLRAVFGLLLLAMVAKVCVLLVVLDEGPEAEGVQRRLLADTVPTTTLGVPPPYNPIFRPNAFFFWFNPEYFATAYLELCRLRGEPPKHVEEDRRVWRDAPPRFVYVPADEPSWAPFEFAQHRSAYVETDIQGLWKLASPPKALAPLP